MTTTATAEANLVIPLHKLAKQLGVRRETVIRWAVAGVAVGPSRVRLAAERAGRKWFTSRAAYERFKAACTGTTPPPEPAPRSAAELRRAHERAMRAIEARRKRTAGRK